MNRTSIYDLIYIIARDVDDYDLSKPNCYARLKTEQWRSSSGSHGDLDGAGRGRLSGEQVPTRSSAKQRGGQGDPYGGLHRLKEAM
jgi:hypothetical protein